MKGGERMTRIRELRQAKGLSMAMLSYEVRIHPSILSLVERRKAPASERVREGLSSFLGIPMREAFDDKGLAV
jgi:DNA-binding helix-turn-helix protein